MPMRANMFEGRQLPDGRRPLLANHQTAHQGISVVSAEADLATPKMVVMADVEDPFVPLPDDLLVNLAESRAVVDTLLDTLPATFAANSKVGHPLIVTAIIIAMPQGRP